MSGHPVRRSASSDNNSVDERACGSRPKERAPTSPLAFPPIPPRTSVPSGHFLNPRTLGSDSNTLRAGFPRLASSSYLVEAIQEEASVLLDSFVTAWQAAIDEARQSVSGGKPGQTSAAPSPFATFKGLYEQRGWHLFQLYWSEHRETRTNIYHAIVRIFTDRLRFLLPLLSTTEDGSIVIDDAKVCEIPQTQILRACGALFGLKLLQSTTSLAGSDVYRSRHMAMIPIEADLFHALLALPRLAEQSLALPEWGDEAGLRPIDDVVFLLQDLMGELPTEAMDEEDSSEEETQGESSKESRFEVLAPTDLSARPALISSHLSTRAELERKRGMWGQVKSTEDDSEGVAQIGMNRAELMRNLLKKRLQLPLLEPLGGMEREEGTAGSADRYRSRSHLTIEHARLEKKGRPSVKAHVATPPGKEAEERLSDSLRQAADRQEKYNREKRRHLDSADLLPTERDVTATGDETITRPSPIDRIVALARQRAVRSLRASVAEQEATRGKAKASDGNEVEQ